MTWQKWRTTATSRRGFLAGAGAVVTLPFLASLRGGAVAAPPGKPPVRLVFWYAPNGIVMDQYRPAAAGALPAELPRILAPLGPVRDDVLVLSGLANPAAMDDLSGEHARGTATYLTGVHIGPPGAPPKNGVSVDRLAADAIGGNTLLRSLELGTAAGTSVGLCHNNYSCAYIRNVSWIDSDTPNPKITEPSLAFERLFGGADPGMSHDEIALRREWRRSVLDVVLDDAISVHGRLDTPDRRKLDEYLTGLRELEVRLERDVGDCTATPPAPAADYPSVVRAMSEITALALECDLTRIVTFMLDDGGSTRSFDFLGIPEAHHDLSHHGGDVDKIEKLAQIDVWEVGEFAWLVQRLRSIQDSDGSSVLDNTLALFSSELSDGNLHLQNDLPVLLAGRGGGYVPQTGRHLVYGGEPPTADLWLAMLDAAGVAADTFGEDGTEPLSLQG